MFSVVFVCQQEVVGPYPTKHWGSVPMMQTNTTHHSPLSHYTLVLPLQPHPSWPWRDGVGVRSFLLLTESNSRVKTLPSLVLSTWSVIITILLVSEKPRDCADIQTEGFRSSGVFNIYPKGAADPEGVEVFCDLHTEGGGWLVSTFCDLHTKSNGVCDSSMTLRINKRGKTISYSLFLIDLKIPPKLWFTLGSPHDKNELFNYPEWYRFNNLVW